MNVGRCLSWTAERFPQRVGIVGERRLTYRQWDARTNQIARALRELGVERGDRVGIALPNTEVMASTHLAVQKIAATSTPFNVRFSVSELAHCLSDASPRVLLTDDSTVELVEEALEELDERPTLIHAGDDPPEGACEFEDLVADQPDGHLDVEVDEDDPSVMLYTAGTTGKPKGVPRTQRNEFSAAVAHVIQCRYEPGESTLVAMPLYHTMGIRSLLSMLVVGGKAVLQPSFEADRAFELIEDEQIRALYLVPTAFHGLTEAGDVSALAGTVRKLAYAGASMTSALTRTLAEAFDPRVFVNHYGSSEVYTVSIQDDATAKPGCAGRPGVFAHWRVVPVSSEGEVSPDDEVEVDEHGEIIADLRAPEAFSGYWRREEATRQSLREGWYFTGDLGRVDEDGDLWVVGRVDDMIITGGENVYPLEVEDVLSNAPDVDEVAVAGLPHDKWGQVVAAFIVPEQGASQQSDHERFAQRVADWIEEGDRLADYKRPRRIVLVDEVPKSPVGKMLRRELVEGNYDAHAEFTVEGGTVERASDASEQG